MIPIIIEKASQEDIDKLNKAIHKAFAKRIIVNAAAVVGTLVLAVVLGNKFSK